MGYGSAVCAYCQRRHDNDYRSSGPLLACVRKDKRIIHFLGTMHVAETPEVGSYCNEEEI